MPDETKTEPDVTILCTECGDMIELKDVRAYILAVHLGMNCPATEKLREP